VVENIHCLKNLALFTLSVISTVCHVIIHADEIKNLKIIKKNVSHLCAPYVGMTTKTALLSDKFSYARLSTGHFAQFNIILRQ